MATAQQRERILSRPIEDEMRESFLDYSMSVIVQRALPDVRDGLKPVHRRILYAMHELGLSPDRAYKKSATVVGDVLGKFHPHGDSAVYDAMVRMVQDFSLRYPLVDGQGNFGSIDGDSAAAYRYTEARLHRLATTILADIDKDTVRWAPNFDGRLDEPVVLPGRAPNLLINGSSGIAVGMSTNVPPHNLREIAAAVKLLAIDPECTIDDLMRHVPGPDFPTGGYIVGREPIDSMYRTGRGRVIMRARIVKEALRGGKSQLVVTELPYAINKTKIIDQIVSVARKKQTEDISDIRDESDRDGMRIVIELKRGADIPQLLKVLYKKTYLQSTFGAIMLALDHGQPREFNLKEMLEAYRDHRIEVIVRRTRFDLEKAEAERHILEGLLIALDNIDEVVKIIRGSSDREEASTELRKAFKLTEEQADAILNMRLARLTQLQGKELKARLRELKSIIKDLKAILDSEDAQIDVMLEELSEIVEKFGDDRRTEIVEEDELPSGDVETEIADEDVVVTVSHEGFAKRMPMHLYRRRVSSGKALAGMEKYEDDYIERIFVARTQGWVLAFTEQGQCHFLSVLDLPESGRASRGQSIYSLLPSAERGDRIVAMLPIDDLEAEDEERVLLFLSESGLVKGTELTEFSNPRSTGLIAAGVKEGDRILDVALSDGEAEVVVFSSGGRAIRFPESDISVQGRTARGVKGIGLKGDDLAISMMLIRREADVLTVTEDGSGKRTPIDEFPLQKRGGQGTMALPSGGKAGRVVAALEVVEGDEVMVVTAGGRVERVAMDDVPVQGRRTQGKSIMKLKKDERVVEVTRSAESRSAQESTAESGSSDGADSNEAEDDAPESPVENSAAGEPESPGTEADADGDDDDDEGQLDLLG